MLLQAHCLSHFKGTLQDLAMARKALERLPWRPAVLPKDFIVDEYMIDEARLWGANSILINVVRPLRISDEEVWNGTTC